MKIIFLFTSVLILLMAVSTATAADADNTTKIEKVDTASVAQAQMPAKEITKVDKKTTKKESKIDYYVSNDGDDTNSGTQESPFKTMQTAINKTTQENEYTIHIAEGTYKGEGNLNLTIPGTNNINFIGSGVNKTIFDGEANFTLPGSGNEAWGGSAFWNNWRNCSGNWFMNITQGEGQFNITGMTIQNCWSNSGSSIAACPTSTIDNRATLNVTNVYFDSNHAGNGAGIRNNNGGTLYVDNCTFTNGTKAQTTGNFGAALYNNGTAIVTNSNIIYNFARWGSVTNDKNITMINCTFKDNHAYDGGSGYKNGPSFTADTGFADFFRPYAVLNLTSTIINCTFDSNQQCDISNGRGDLTVDNCVFNHSTGVYLFPNNNRNNQYMPTQIIENNQFIDMQPSTVFASLISATTPSVSVRSLSGYPLLIKNNTIDVRDSNYGYGLYLTANATAVNNTMNNYIYVAGANNIIENNTVNTATVNSISLATAAKNCTIINNTLTTSSADGDLSIKALADTIIQDNKPETYTYVVTNENYTTYFDENGIARKDVITNGSKIILSGEITDKDFIFDNIKVLVDTQSNTLTDVTFTTQNNAQVSLNNLKIKNTKNDKGYIILFNSTKNTLNKTTIDATTDKALQAIKIEEDSNKIVDVTLNMTAPAYDTEWRENYAIGTVPTTGMFIRSSHNYISGTKLFVYAPTKDPNSFAPSVDGLDIQSKNVGEFVTDNQIRNTRINVTGGSYVYALNLARAKNTMTTLSYFIANSDFYAVSVQMGDAKDNTIAGYMHAYADSIAYGLYSTAMATGTSNNTNISKLYIQGMDAPTATGIEIDGASNIIMGDATFTINGNTTKAIVVHPDFYGNAPENITINKLTVTLNGNTDDSIMMSFNNVTNLYMNASSIRSTSGKGINLEDSDNAVIENNYINAANMYGGNGAITTNKEATLRNNTPTLVLLTDDNYSNFFDENATLKVDADVIAIGGDLYNKDIKIDLPTKLYNITNTADYTIYNGTITIYGNSSVYSSPTKVLRVTGLKFENQNKPVFKDELEGTIQCNVYFENCDIDVTGDDIVAFDAFNNNSYIYLDVSDSNISLSGKNAVAISYSGYNRGQPVYVTDNNIIIVAEESAKALETNQATLQFSSNNVEITAKNAIAVNAQNSSISYHNFRYNDISVTGDNVSALYYEKPDTSTSYVEDNSITLDTNNPTTAISVIGNRGAYVQRNNIIINTNNDETPIIYSNSTTSVTNNYLESRDLCGDDAVESAGTVSGNKPVVGGRNITINIADVELLPGEENNITINVTNSFDEVIGGNITVTIDDEEIPINDGVVKYTPQKAGDVTVKVTYVDPNGNYQTKTETSTLTAIKRNSTAQTVIEEPVLGETTELTAQFYDDNGIAVNGGKAIFRINGKTLRNDQGEVIYVDVVNGTATLPDVNITGEWMKPDTTIQAVYSGTDEFDPIITEKTTVNVTKPEATVTLTAPTEATAGQEITLTATVTDGDKLVNSGRIAFKFNGKTLKDENGKAIYVNVKDGIATTTYKIPAKTKAKSYTLTAVFIDDTYDRVEATREIVISKA